MGKFKEDGAFSWEGLKVSKETKGYKHNKKSGTHVDTQGIAS